MRQQTVRIQTLISAFVEYNLINQDFYLCKVNK